MPPYIENPYCYIVTELQCDVSKKKRILILWFSEKILFLQP